MKHPIHHVTGFDLMDGYRIRVRFEDGLEREIDLRPVLHGPFYGPLRDPEVFRGVVLDPEIRNLVWPNGADFDPWTLHDWPLVKDSLVESLSRHAGARVLA